MKEIYCSCVYLFNEHVSNMNIIYYVMKLGETDKVLSDYPFFFFYC